MLSMVRCIKSMDIDTFDIILRVLCNFIYLISISRGRTTTTQGAEKTLVETFLSILSFLVKNVERRSNHLEIMQIFLEVGPLKELLQGTL